VTNTTETYWDVDGVSLQTYAHNIVTIGGDRAKPPPLRGEDIEIPFMPGDLFVPKVIGPNVITLGMWVTGADEDGNIPVDADMRIEYDQNWRALRRLLFRRKAQMTLTKRFWVPESELTEAGMVVDELPRLGDYRLLTASAKASYAGGLTPEMTGGTRANFTVDLKVNGGFFYSAPIEVDFSIATGGVNPGPTRSIYVLGDDTTTAIGVEFEGPLTAAKIENETNGVWFRYNTAIADGIKASVEVHEFQARHDLDGTTYKSRGYVQHDGDPFWLTLEPGDNDLKLTVTGGTGTAKMTYQPGWF
jgi:hypothetical protein